MHLFHSAWFWTTRNISSGQLRQRLGSRARSLMLLPAVCGFGMAQADAPRDTVGHVDNGALQGFEKRGMDVVLWIPYARDLWDSTGLCRARQRHVQPLDLAMSAMQALTSLTLEIRLLPATPATAIDQRPRARC